MAVLVESFHFESKAKCTSEDATRFEGHAGDGWRDFYDSHPIPHLDGTADLVVWFIHHVLLVFPTT